MTAVVVVGSGIAGLTAALHAVASGCHETHVTKDVLDHANTRYAQGGIAGVMFAVDGARVVLVEGGPTLNGALVAAGLVDEVCLSLAPRLVGGTSARLAHGPDPSAVEALPLHRVLTEDGLLFLRYAR